MRWLRLLKKNKSGMLILDLAASLTIVAFLIWIFGGIIGTLSQNAKETALRYGLNNLRLSLNLYKMIKESYPKDLRDLMQSSIILAKSEKLLFSEKFLFSLAIDKQGNAIDPFGNKFYYDPRKGVVGSQTKGYENWW